MVREFHCFFKRDFSFLFPQKVRLCADEDDVFETLRIILVSLIVAIRPSASIAARADAVRQKIVDLSF